MDETRKVALVTGSSTGIGASIAVELAKAGFRLIIHGRSPSPELDQTAKAIVELGGEVETVTADFTNRDNLAPFCDQCWSRFGHMEVLVNNAGGDVLTGDRADNNFESKLAYLLNVDVAATLILSKNLGSRMRDFATNNSFPTGGCSIVNIGWDQAEQGMAGDSGEMFATTKGAIMSMTRSLAQSFAPTIRVNCVAPGWIQTQWGHSTSEHWQKRAVNESLMQRWGTPSDVANVVAFLASHQASFVSGQIINANGGFQYCNENK